MQRHSCLVIILLSVVLVSHTVEAQARRILLDTDVDTEDLCALLYLLKLNRSNFAVEAVTISANSWSDAGHAVNQIYDILYMMGRDDVSVGVGGEGGVLDDGTILPDVGGYLPLIEQGMTTAGGCRYRQSIPVGQSGRLDTNTNHGLRREFLPQGRRRYIPLRTPTSQQLLIEKVSAGPITILMIGSASNVAYFLMNNPHLKKNIEHIYIMGGGVRLGNPGNVFTSFASNPYAEFNIFVDPFAAYQVIHSGVPITLVPLDATNTVPVDKNFFEAFEKKQGTYEALYCFKSLKMARDTWPNDHFYSNYFLWDSFAIGVAASVMLNPDDKNGGNEFAEMEYMNITVVTSDEPYGTEDGSNPFFDGRQAPKFALSKGGVHSGHVQTGLTDPFCIVKDSTKGKCQDGYTKEIHSPDSARVLVATRSKPSTEPNSQVKVEFLNSFLDVLNHPQQAGKFNFTNQFPYYREVLHKLDFGTRSLGKPVVFDMDMSPGDFLALLYLLKTPVEVINLKAIIVSPTGWANAATIDVIYDFLHMMGRDDIPVGLGEVIAANQSDPMFPSVGGCKYVKAIPHGRGGFLDSDTLYGLARHLPRSSRRYTAENSVAFGAPRNTDRPELRQPRAMKVWDSMVKSLEAGSKVTYLTNGPLTNLARIVVSKDYNSSVIQEVYVVGGHLSHGSWDKGNILNMHPNSYAEMNMFLDPFAAKAVFESSLNITLIPLEAQRKVSSFTELLQRLKGTNKSAEGLFAHHLLSKLHRLQQTHLRYHHMDTFLGEILGVALLAGDHSLLKPTLQVQSIKFLADGDESTDGQILIDEKQGKVVTALKHIDSDAYYAVIADRLGEKKQSAVVGSFDDQKRMWRMPLE